MSATQRTARMAARGITIRGDEVRVKGRLARYVVRGDNGRWFTYPVSHRSHADPLGGADQHPCTGHSTRGDAVISWAIDAGLWHRPQSE